MKGFIYGGLLLFGSLLVSCIGSGFSDTQRQECVDRKEGYTIYSGWGFSVQIPNNITGASSRTYIDFILYAFVDTIEAEKKGLLFAYAGSHPSFGDDTPTMCNKQSFLIHGLKTKSIQWKDNDNLFYREVLVKMPYTYKLESNVFLPQYIHFWYKGLSDQEKELADEIIMSIRSTNHEVD